MSDAAPARFAPGDRVRVCSTDPDHHTRAPRYVRGHQGVVVESHGQVQGPVWLLFLHTRQGLLSRRHYLGCMDGDNEDFAFGSAQWTGPNTVRVAEGDGRTFDVTIGNDGTPDHTIGSKDACYRL